MGRPVLMFSQGSTGPYIGLGHEGRSVRYGYGPVVKLQKPCNYQAPDAFVVVLVEHCKVELGAHIGIRKLVLRGRLCRRKALRNAQFECLTAPAGNRQKPGDQNPTPAPHAEPP